jgi:hypothetical protein
VIVIDQSQQQIRRQFDTVAYLTDKYGFIHKLLEKQQRRLKKRLQAYCFESPAAASAKKRVMAIYP